ncbi:hypothetical protein IWX90DRAFT_237848 [Phyllosticta citrichinensis]|uniref:Uncharacterized protein n=1 Tax=Phyllosticta citrichinensis TaxID=1130410 RepID=A0ABR1XPZ5_9PEZI
MVPLHFPEVVLVLLEARTWSHTLGGRVGWVGADQPVNGCLPRPQSQPSRYLKVSCCSTPVAWSVYAVRSSNAPLYSRTRRKPTNTKRKKTGSPATPAVSQQHFTYYSGHKRLGFTAVRLGKKAEVRASQHQPHFTLYARDISELLVSLD